MTQNNEIADSIERTLNRYFDDLDGSTPSGIYPMVIQIVEQSLLTCVMNRAKGNQSHAAQMLGINRNTLRRKLSDHGML